MPGPIIEQIRVQPAAAADGPVAFQIETPTTGAPPAGTELTVAGWAIGRAQPVTRIRVARPHELLGSAPVEGERPDVAAHLTDPAGANQSGFSVTVDALRLEPEFRLRVRAELANGDTVTLATIRGRRRTEFDGYRPVFQPLIVTSLGRTGSTWLMRLLSAHPALVTYQQYPYEVRPAKYWLHLFDVLTARPNPAKTVGQPNEFHLETLAVGANPFRAPSFAALPELEAWSAATYVERLAAFCQRSIDEWYRIVATAQGKPDVSYFVEKQFPDHTPRLARSLYPRGREIVLVRDFRDMAASILAYNLRRGTDDFGRSGHETDAAWLNDMARHANSLAMAWRRRGESAHLVRYEDLIARPATTLRATFAYLGIDDAEPLVTDIIAQATADGDELKRHQTTRDPAASIGRWRTDLPAELREEAGQVLYKALVTFGYESAIAVAPPDDEERPG